jgi:OOP family OmpA-OmpF porin
MVVALTLCVGVVAAQAKFVPKVDNFILFADQSGSMYMHSKTMGEVKMVLAKKVMMELNDAICPLQYNGGLYLFAPFQQMLAPMPYDQAALAKAIQEIPSKNAIFDRLTPMGPGMAALSPVLDNLSGKTAVIIVSDGRANQGISPVTEAKAIYSKYPNVCLDVISLADTPEGKANLEEISKMGNCVMVEAADLLKSKEAVQQFVHEVLCEEVAEQETIVLRGINFDFDKSNIKPEFTPVLNEAADMLKQHPNVNVVVEGYTDSIGTVSYNLKLSQRRAEAVYDYLVKEGVAPDRMKTVGYGKSNPVASNATAEGRYLNRRVELKVVQ